MVEASGNPKTPQFATGALGAPKSNSANKSVTYGWSGRADSNCRPPAPKAVSSLRRKCPILNYLRFKRMAGSCCNLWSLVAHGGFRQLHFYLQRYNKDAMKLEIEVNVADDAADKVELQEHLRKEAILALFAD